MPSNRPAVWLITGTSPIKYYCRTDRAYAYAIGASSSLGYRLCLAALARGDLVIASASLQKEVDRLCSIGAYGIRIDSEMGFGQLRDRIHAAVSYYGRIDFLINNPDATPQRDSRYVLDLYISVPSSFPTHIHPFHLSVQSAYDTNTFSYTAILVTKAVSQVSTIRQIVVIVPNSRPGHSHHVCPLLHNFNPSAIDLITSNRVSPVCTSTNHFSSHHLTGSQ